MLDRLKSQLLTLLVLAVALRLAVWLIAPALPLLTSFLFLILLLTMILGFVFKR
jgi:hypothetical protein